MSVYLGWFFCLKVVSLSLHQLDCKLLKAWFSKKLTFWTSLIRTNVNLFSVFTRIKLDLSCIFWHDLFLIAYMIRKITLIIPPPHPHPPKKKTYILLLIIQRNMVGRRHNFKWDCSNVLVNWMPTYLSHVFNHSYLRCLFYLSMIVRVTIFILLDQEISIINKPHSLSFNNL